MKAYGRICLSLDADEVSLNTVAWEESAETVTSGKFKESEQPKKL
jgi:hypothetical protein